MGECFGGNPGAIGTPNRDRLPKENGPFIGAPDWAIEILSPDHSMTRLIAKLQICLGEGMQVGWIVDPMEQVVMVLLPGDRVLQQRHQAPQNFLTAHNAALGTLRTHY